MITEEELSLTQQAKGRKILLSFSFLNGIALTFITGNILSLYLLKVGCSTPVVAVIASFGYLGTLFALVGKNAISRLGAGLTLRLAWLFCGLTAIILALIPFMEYIKLNQYWVILLITCVTFLFFVFKSIGTATTQPLMGEFTNSDNRGEFSSKYFLCYTIANILAMLCIISLFYCHKTLIIFQLLILLGGLIKLACSYLFIGLHETEVPRNSARSIITKKLLFTIWNNKSYRNFLFCRSFSRAGLILIVPISILALKQLYGVSDLIALIFAFIQLGGGITITYLNGIISEETGPKPLLVIYVMLLFVISILWIFAPTHFNWGYCFVIFFLGGVCLCGMDACLNYFYLTIIPKENSVGISLWYTVIGGAIAGIAGLLLGGGLIRIITLLASHNCIFRLYYCVMLILMTPIFYIVYKQKSTSSWNILDVLRLSIDPHEMHTIYVMHRLQKYSSAKDELKNVLKLESMNSSLPQEQLIYYLNSPKYKVRIHALRALYGTKLKQKTINAVLKELQIGEYTTAYLAGIILADNHVKESIPLMRKYLYSKDHQLVGCCMRGLVMLDDKDSFHQIIELYKQTKIPSILINGSTALSTMNDSHMLLILLEKFVEITNWTKKAIGNFKGCDGDKHKNYALTMYMRRDAVINEIISCIADIAGIGDSFYEFLRIYDSHHETGILNLCEQVIDRNPNTNLGSPKKALHDYSRGKIKITNIIEFLKNSANAIEQDAVVSILSNFLSKLKPRQINTKLIYCIFLILFIHNGKKI
jgi:hypothetical protein